MGLCKLLLRFVNVSLQIETTHCSLDYTGYQFLLPKFSQVESVFQYALINASAGGIFAMKLIL